MQGEQEKNDKMGRVRRVKKRWILRKGLKKISRGWRISRGAG